MFCQVSPDGQEITLSNASFSDVLAVIQIWLHKDRAIIYTNPVDLSEYIERIEFEE